MNEFEKYLSQEEIKKLFNYDPETGIFTWIVKPCDKVSIGDISGHLRKDGYRMIQIKGKKYLAHRLSFLYMTGRLPEMIDHINGNKSDNRFSNLREATSSQNLCNQGIRSNNTSGYKGVVRHKSNQKWMAQIGIDGKKKYLGIFATAELASEAYKQGSLKYHGEFGKTE